MCTTTHLRGNALRSANDGAIAKCARSEVGLWEVAVVLDVVNNVMEVSFDRVRSAQ